MISVDFYILPDDQLENLQRYSCKLAEEYWQSGGRVLIQTDSSDDSQSLDSLLWDIRDESFIPHGIATLEPVDQQQPILISHQKINDNNFQLVINLSSRPADVSNDELSIKEILNQNDQRKQSGRQNYKTYRELGYTLKHHTLESING